MLGSRRSLAFTTATIAAVLLAGCASPPREQQGAPDPFQGKGIPIDALDAFRIANVNASRDHPNARLALVAGGEYEDETGLPNGTARVWDVYFAEPETDTVYQYVVAGQGIGVDRVLRPTPQGFPTSSILEGWTLSSTQAFTRAGEHVPEFWEVAHARGAHVTFQIEPQGDKAGWSLRARLGEREVHVLIDAKTGERI